MDLGLLMQNGFGFTNAKWIWVSWCKTYLGFLIFGFPQRTSFYWGCHLHVQFKISSVINNVKAKDAYASFQKPTGSATSLRVSKYFPEEIAASDCTPDDVYSWDAPFESGETVPCGGMDVPLNQFFGGKPGDRKYTLTDSATGKTTNFGFNACPALIKGDLSKYDIELI